MDNAPFLYRRSLRSTSTASLIEGFVSSRSSEPGPSVEIAQGPVRATVQVQVAGESPHPLSLDGSGCGRLRLAPQAGGTSITILFEGCAILRGSTPHYGTAR